jgi:DNA repair ATPase RecN
MDNSNDNSSEDMYIDDDLLNSPTEISASWDTWTALQVREISRLVKYHTDMIAYITECREKGPSREPPPKKSRSDIMKQLYIEKTARKQGTTSISQMTDDEFHQYLTSMLDNSSDGKPSLEQIPTQLSELPAYLDKAYRNLQYAEKKTLQAHFEMGKSLNLAKQQFECEKRKKRMKQTWRMWIEENTQIKEACARKHREIADLVSKYPKLETLSMTYTDFLKIKNKIAEVFSESSFIGQKWK